MALCLHALAWTMSCLAAQDPKDPQDVIKAFDSDLVDAIRTAGKDQGVRSKLAAAALKVFDTALAASVDKAPKSRWGCHQDMMERLITAEKHYGEEGDKSERTLWIGACKKVFTFEFGRAQEPSADQPPTTEEVFNELFDAISRVRKNFPGEHADDLRKAAYGAAKQVFSERLKNARAPKKDPQNAYAEELIRTDKNFPLPQADKPATPTPAPAPSSGKGGSSGGSKSSGGSSKGGSGGGSSAEPVKKAFDYNTEPNNILKTAAKQGFDRALAAPK